jgi:stearoyl-CoA desaturase (delta-9 desaturase)
VGSRSLHDALTAPRALDWTNVIVLGVAHLLAIAAVLWLAFVRASPWTIGLGLLWFLLCGLAITGGYHRLFAHPTYRARSIVRAFYLVFGASAVQNSALKWASDHRVHHAKTDHDEDPYSVRRGLLWAHIAWVLFRDGEPGQLRGVKDLEADALVRWQHRHYVVIAILVGAVAPAAIGMLWGDPIGAFLVAGILRLVLQWHATGAVNSLAHRFGSQPYSKSGSARDSHWTALVTFGEGYHNFHHRFQADFRNGVRWFHFDPTKWFVCTLALLGLATGLRRTSPTAIQRARAAAVAEFSQSSPGTSPRGGSDAA